MSIRFCALSTWDGRCYRVKKDIPIDEELTRRAGKASMRGLLSIQMHELKA